MFVCLFKKNHKTTNTQPPLYTDNSLKFVVNSLGFASRERKSYGAMYLSRTKISGKYYPSAHKQRKANSNHNLKFNLSFIYIWSWPSYATAQITIVTVTAKATFHQISLPSSKGRRVIRKINSPLITESVNITKDRYNCHSAFGNLYNNFSIVRGGLSHVRQCANEEHKNNSSNASENKTVAKKHFLERNVKIQTRKP